MGPVVLCTFVIPAATSGRGGVDATKENRAAGRCVRYLPARIGVYPFTFMMIVLFLPFTNYCIIVLHTRYNYCLHTLY